MRLAKPRRRQIVAALLGQAAPALPRGLREEEVMRLVVPFAAGSYTDTVARLAAPGLAQRLGRTIIVENRGAANGIIGAEFVARRAPADGMTLLVGGASVNTIDPSFYDGTRALPRLYQRGDREMLRVARDAGIPPQ